MRMGTKSILFGAHQLLIHPLFVAAAWTKLYGFPFDPRLWASFFLHDIGYWGTAEMDGPEGVEHPLRGAQIMHRLFDGTRVIGWKMPKHTPILVRDSRWFDFTIGHSRSYAKKHGIKASRLCAADKLATALTPGWLYLPMVSLTGEIKEYQNGVIQGYMNGSKSISYEWAIITSIGDKRGWFRMLQEYMAKAAYDMVRDAT